MQNLEPVLLTNSNNYKFENIFTPWWYIIGLGCILVKSNTSFKTWCLLFSFRILWYVFYLLICFSLFLIHLFSLSLYLTLSIHFWYFYSVAILNAKSDIYHIINTSHSLYNIFHSKSLFNVFTWKISGLLINSRG